MVVANSSVPCFFFLTFSSCSACLCLSARPSPAVHSVVRSTEPRTCCAHSKAQAGDGLKSRARKAKVIPQSQLQSHATSSVHSLVPNPNSAAATIPCANESERCCFRGLACHYALERRVRRCSTRRRVRKRWIGISNPSYPCHAHASMRNSCSTCSMRTMS